jgi:co-chaperonin GroES (HSP10)
MQLLKELYGNRILVKRVEYAPDGRKAIILTQSAVTEIQQRFNTVDGEILMVGWGSTIKEHFPHLKVGNVIRFRRDMGTVKQEDGTEIVHIDDVLGMVEGDPKKQ